MMFLHHPGLDADIVIQANLLNTLLHKLNLNSSCVIDYFMTSV